MRSLHDDDGFWEGDPRPEDDPKSECGRCPKGHLVYKPPRRSDGRYLCFLCRFEKDDLVVVGIGEDSGYVCRVEQVNVDEVKVRLFDVKPEGVGVLKGGGRSREASLGPSLALPPPLKLRRTGAALPRE